MRHPASNTHALLGDALRRSCHYLDDVGERSVAPRPEAIAALRRL